MHLLLIARKHRLGYDPHNTMVVGIPLRDNTYMTWEERAAYFNQLRQGVAAIPGVVSAAVSTLATPPANGIDERIEIMGAPAVEEQQIRLNMVSPEYLPPPYSVDVRANLGPSRDDAERTLGDDQRNDGTRVLAQW